VIRISFFFHNNYILELSQETKKAKKGKKGDRPLFVFLVFLDEKKYNPPE